MDINKLKRAVGIVEEQNEIPQRLINQVVSQYSQELDELIATTLHIISLVESGEVEEYPQERLELDMIKIPTLMYQATSQLAQLGSLWDMSKNKKVEVYNQTLRLATGTVQDKKAETENKTLEYQITEDIYKRAYEVLKSKVDKADAVYSALKKVYNKREIELNIFRKER